MGENYIAAELERIASEIRSGRLVVRQHAIAYSMGALPGTSRYDGYEYFTAELVMRTPLEPAMERCMRELQESTNE